MSGKKKKIIILNLAEFYCFFKTKLQRQFVKHFFVKNRKQMKNWFLNCFFCFFFFLRLAI